jgi:equilibrative nucleoside transporter 1/2/3
MNTPLSQADSDGLLYLSQPISSNLHQRHGYSPISEEDIHNNEDSGLPNNATDDDLFPAEPPKDAWNIAYFIFFALGVGMLFPWNVFINANEYFRARLRGSPFVDNYANFFSIGYMISNVLWLAIALRAQSHARPMKRIINSLVLNALIFLACLTLTRVKGLAPQTDFALNIFMVVICGASTAYLQNGVFGLASIFPSIYVQAVMSGQGLAGSAVAISQIMTLLVKSHDDLSVEVNLSF